MEDYEESRYDENLNVDTTQNNASKYHHCICCNSSYIDDSINHIDTPEHRFNFMLYEWNNYRKALISNSNGVELLIEPKKINGCVYNYHEEPSKGKHCLKITPVDFLKHNGTIEFLCKIKNIRRSSNVIITAGRLLHPYSLYSFQDPNNNLGNNLYPELEPKADYTVIVSYKIENSVTIGSYEIPVSFTLQPVVENSIPFSIVRSIIVSVEERSLDNEVVGSSPFTSKDWHKDTKIISPVKETKSFNMYPIPPAYHKFLKYGLRVNKMVGNDYKKIEEIRNYLKPGYVTPNNYKMFWHIVLWLEEAAQDMMLKRYNMENVHMKIIKGSNLELEVPGLAEKRPSVIVGDMIQIRVHDDHMAYQGIIRQVNDKTVEIGYVDNQLISYLRIAPNIELDVQFLLGRLPLERMHEGMDQVVLTGMVPALFPSNNLENVRVPHTFIIRDSDFTNKMILNNREQKTAVINILNGTSATAPYIVFGPPGTGKTVTIVEAILQIKNNTKKKILVCAPANAACNMLAEKLMMDCNKDELIRIMSETVDLDTVNPLLLEYTNCEDKVFRKVAPQELIKYRIVITTLIHIGRYTRRYHPDVVFIDEAAQASEPEVCCAIGMLEKGKQIILAGDPKQLGTIVASAVAEKYGLGKSLLERLMDQDIYKSGNQNFMTMLKFNFRSHSTILQIPNELFYGGQLVPVSATSENDPLSKLFVFKKIQNLYKVKKNNSKKCSYPGQALEFCSILSTECRQGRSPSYFNHKEIQMVFKYVEALTSIKFQDEEYNVLPAQIGIVTPYIRQVYKIRDFLKKNNFGGVEVGTTETFQGREKRVIIISTVRAQEDLLLYDKKYNLGFVRHEKRFNVALTRAMSKLIVIGCAHVLGTDSKWSQFIEFSTELHAFFGAPYAKRTKTVREDITARFQDIKKGHS